MQRAQKGLKTDDLLGAGAIPAQNARGREIEPRTEHGRNPVRSSPWYQVEFGGGAKNDELVMVGLMPGNALQSSAIEEWIQSLRNKFAYYSVQIRRVTTAKKTAQQNFLGALVGERSKREEKQNWGTGKEPGNKCEKGTGKLTAKWKKRIGAGDGSIEIK